MSLAQDIDRVLDEATIKLLTLTSPAAYLAAARREEAQNIPVYPDQTCVETFGVAGVTDPRAVLGRCEQCGARFWTGLHGQPQRFCSRNCSALWHYHRNPGYRAKTLARLRARYARRKAERRAA